MAAVWCEEQQSALGICSCGAPRGSSIWQCLYQPPQCVPDLRAQSVRVRLLWLALGVKSLNRQAQSQQVENGLLAGRSGKNCKPCWQGTVNLADFETEFSNNLA
jgi:hypothetical protein